MDIKRHFFENDGSLNLILGQSHFIKTIEDLAVIVKTTVPSAKFGIAFCEASGPCLVRFEYNDDGLREKAVNMMLKLNSGHSFVIYLKDCYPINILSKIKMCDEVCRIYCATANPLTVLTVQDNNGAGIIGVIDGVSPKGVESDADKIDRREFLRKIGAPSVPLSHIDTSKFSTSEKQLFDLLTSRSPQIVPFAEISTSLYSAAKSIQRLRDQLESQGLSGSFIQTKRGEGYLLTN